MKYTYGQLVKIKERYSFHNNNNIYNYFLNEGEIHRHCTGYSKGRWNKYCDAIANENLGEIITDENIVAKFKRKSEEIDLDPSKLYEFNI